MDFNYFMSKLKKWQEQSHMFIVNKQRLHEMETAYDTLKNIICEYDPSAKFETEMNTMNTLNVGDASFSIETDEIIVHKSNMSDFISSIKTATNFEIYPLTNGKIRIAIEFDGIMDVIR